MIDPHFLNKLYYICLARGRTERRRKQRHQTNKKKKKKESAGRKVGQKFLPTATLQPRESSPNSPNHKHQVREMLHPHKRRPVIPPRSDEARYPTGAVHAYSRLVHSFWEPYSALGSARQSRSGKSGPPLLYVRGTPINTCSKHPSIGIINPVLLKLPAEEKSSTDSRRV